MTVSSEKQQQQQQQQQIVLQVKFSPGGSCWRLFECKYLKQEQWITDNIYKVFCDCWTLGMNKLISVGLGLWCLLLLLLSFVIVVCCMLLLSFLFFLSFFLSFLLSWRWDLKLEGTSTFSYFSSLRPCWSPVWSIQSSAPLLLTAPQAEKASICPKAVGKNTHNSDPVKWREYSETTTTTTKHLINFG